MATPSTTAPGPTRSCARAVTPSKPGLRKSSATLWVTSSSAFRRVTKKRRATKTKDSIMQFGLTETQQTLKNTVRKFLAAECPISGGRKRMETTTALDPALWRKISEQGWNGMILAEEHGGFGMGMVEMAAA